MENPDPATATVSELTTAIAYHNQRYWEDNRPEISDADYDRLTEALQKLDPENPLLTAVNAVSVASDGKVHHREPMLSLDKAYSLEALLEWISKYARTPDEMILVEPKYDGISASFDGKILSTRGDGETGENITAKLPLIELEAPGYIGKVDRPARGEIIIRNDDFATIYKNIRKKDGGTYKNPRNAVAGIMGLKDIREMMLQKAKLTLIDYNLISFKVPADKLKEKWENLKTELAGLPYPMDGIVLKFADSTFRKSLGATAHHPRGEIAYKFTNLQQRTTLLGVEWSFGKNCLTPVALLEAVELSGITIKRASLHNAQNIEEMGLMTGDYVTVERAGDVIPYISSSEPGEKRTSPWITNCPSCGTALVRRGPELCCPSSECPEMRLRRLLAAVRNLGIERLGEPTLRKLTDVFNIKSLSDLFALTVSDLLKVEGFQQKSADNLINEIQKARNVDETQLIAALNIPNVGANIAALLLEKFTVSELRTADPESLAQIQGIGPERANAVVRTLRESAEELDELIAALNIRRTVSATELQTVCFTGKMPEKRSYYEALAASRNMRAVDSVSSTLSLLVAADPEGSSSKLNNARKLNVKIISLEEFLAIAPSAAAPSHETGKTNSESVSCEEKWISDDLFGF